MEKLPNMDIEFDAVKELIRTLRKTSLPNRQITNILEEVAAICDLRTLIIHDRIATEYRRVADGEIGPRVALDRLLVSFHLPHPRPLRVPEDEAKMMCGYREDGYSIREISAIFERSTETVHRLTADVGFSAKQTPETSSPSPEEIYGRSSKFFSNPAGERSQT